MSNILLIKENIEAKVIEVPSWEAEIAHAEELAQKRIQVKESTSRTLECMSDNVLEQMKIYFEEISRPIWHYCQVTEESFPYINDKFSYVARLEPLDEIIRGHRCQVGFSYGLNYHTIIKWYKGEANIIVMDERSKIEDVTEMAKHFKEAQHSLKTRYNSFFRLINSSNQEAINKTMNQMEVLSKFEL